MGAGGLTVQLALCSGPLALQVCSTAVTHPPWMHTPESLLLPLCSPTRSLGATSPTGCWSQPAVPAGSPHPRQSACSQAQASPYPWRVLFHLVLVAVGTAGMASPEAVLTELVIVALLAAVAEPHHALAVAVGTLNGMEDCGRETPSFNPKQRNPRKSRCEKSLNGRVNLFFFSLGICDIRCCLCSDPLSSMYKNSCALPWIWPEPWALSLWLLLDRYLCLCLHQQEIRSNCI